MRCERTDERNKERKKERKTQRVEKGEIKETEMKDTKEDRERKCQYESTFCRTPSITYRPLHDLSQY